MKNPSIYLLIFLCVAINSEGQKIGKLLEKANSIKQGAEQIRNGSQNLSGDLKTLKENFLFIKNEKNGTITRIKSTSQLDGLCDVTPGNPRKDKLYSVESAQENGNNLLRGRFSVGNECVDSPHSIVGNYQRMKGEVVGFEWTILVTISRNEKEISVIHDYSEKVKKHNPSFTNHPYLQTFYLSGDTLMCKSFITKENFSNNTNSISTAFARFTNSEIHFLNTGMYQLDQTNWTCTFEGNKEMAMMHFLFGIFIHLDKGVFAAHLEKMDAAKIEEDNRIMRINQQEEYMAAEKSCHYCNKKYTGVSYSFGRWRSENNPCGDEIEIVYVNAFCSRKCALDHCKATRP
jgi:hypothetical protein